MFFNFPCLLIMGIVFLSIFVCCGKWYILQISAGSLDAEHLFLPTGRGEPTFLDTMVMSLAETTKTKTGLWSMRSRWNYKNRTIFILIYLITGTCTLKIGNIDIMLPFLVSRYCLSGGRNGLIFDSSPLALKKNMKLWGE